MVIQKKDLGTISIITKSDGKQVIEFAPSTEIDLTGIIEAIKSISIEKGTADRNIDDHFKELLIKSKLPFTVYEMASYQGIRSNIDNKTLIYWNYNARSKYLSISPKTEIALKNKTFVNLKIPKKWSFTEDGKDLICENNYFFVLDYKDFQAQLIEKIESQSPEISYYFIKYCKPRILNRQFDKLQFSLDLNSWKEYDEESELLKSYYDSGLVEEQEHRLFNQRDSYGSSFYMGSSGECYADKLDCLWQEMGDQFLDMEDVIRDLSNSPNIAIPVDVDTRFPQTLRVRLRTIEEINVFFDRLIPSCIGH
jgi:hypothetical protein